VQRVVVVLFRKPRSVERRSVKHRGIALGTIGAIGLNACARPPADLVIASKHEVSKLWQQAQGNHVMARRDFLQGANQGMLHRRIAHLRIGALGVNALQRVGQVRKCDFVIRRRSQKMEAAAQAH
jgi:hypothetical protein